MAMCMLVHLWWGVLQQTDAEAGDTWSTWNGKGGTREIPGTIPMASPKKASPKQRHRRSGEAVGAMVLFMNEERVRFVCTLWCAMSKLGQPSEAEQRSRHHQVS